MRIILPELAMRLGAADAADPALAKRIAEALGYVAGAEVALWVNPRYITRAGRRVGAGLRRDPAALRVHRARG